MRLGTRDLERAAPGGCGSKEQERDRGDPERTRAPFCNGMDDY
jgi:hypothetical protein